MVMYLLLFQLFTFHNVMACILLISVNNKEDDSNNDGTANNVYEYILDANDRVIRIERDYGNDGTVNAVTHQTWLQI